MIAGNLLERSVFVRELLPQDLKIEIEHLSRNEAMEVAEFLARVVGRGHAQQMDATGRKQWVAELKRNRSKSLDAPSWLWSSVVQLVAAHEAALAALSPVRALRRRLKFSDLCICRSGHGRAIDQVRGASPGRSIVAIERNQAVPVAAQEHCEEAAKLACIRRGRSAPLRSTMSEKMCLRGD